MKYAKLSKDGEALGFYDDEIHGASIPADAVEITEDQWQALLMPRRRAVVRGGKVIEVEDVPEPVEDRQRTARARIDDAAGRARARLLGDGKLIEVEYLVVAEEARKASKPSTKESDIVKASDSWRAALLQIRDIRMNGKAAVMEADPDDIDTVAAEVVAELDAIE